MATPVEEKSPSTPRLYDAFGVEIPHEAPPPTETRFIFPDTALNRYRDYPSRDLTPQKLASFLDLADMGDPSALIQLEEEILEKDSKTGSVFQTRISAVMATPHQIMPVDESDEATEIADFVKDVLDNCNFEEMLQNQLDAIPKPFAVTFVDWAYQPHEGRGYATVPVKFTPINQRHFRWAEKRDQLLYVRDRMKPQEAVPLRAYESVRSLFVTRRDHPTRAGLMRPIVWLYLFKSYAMKDWASWTDRFGMPIRIAKVARQDFENEKLLTEVRSALRRLGSDASGIIPSDAEIDIRETVGGQPVFAAWIDYIDRAIAQAVLGHELSSQASAGQGMYGVSAAKDVRQDILEADCEMLAADVRRDVFIPLVGWNYGWDKIGLAPNLWFSYEQEADQMQQANVMAIVAKTFRELPFSKHQIREMFNIEPPQGMQEDIEDDAIFPTKPAPNPFGIGGNAADDEEEDVDGGPPLRRVASTTGTLSAKNRRMLRERKDAKRRVVVAQAVVGELARRGVSKASKEFADMREPIRATVRRGVEEGWSADRTIREVANLFPRLKAKGAQRAVREQLALARLYGRVTGRK